MNKCEICQVISDTSQSLLTTKHWTVSLAPDQGYLGRCYVTLLDHKASLGELTDDEWKEFSDIARRLERAVNQAWGAEPANWACMMNNAYRNEPADPHVHWHFRPRHPKPVQLNDLIFEDPLYGSHYNRDQRRKLDEDTYAIIKDSIKKFL